MAEAADKKSSRSLWLLLILLLLLIGGALAYYFLVWNNTTFTTRFRGCDDAGRCADFTLHAPGVGYSFVYAKTGLNPVEDEGGVVEPSLGPVLAAFEKDIKEGVIAAGLASRESGPGFDNHKLSACRSKALSDRLAAAQSEADLSVPMYRIALGPYLPAEDDEPGDTTVERLVVMAFIRAADPGVDLSQALRNGVAENLESALAQAFVAGEITRQLDFTRYDCWTDKFSVTPSAELRSVCYAEGIDFEASCEAMK